MLFLFLGGIGVKLWLPLCPNWMFLRSTLLFDIWWFSAPFLNLCAGGILCLRIKSLLFVYLVCFVVLFPHFVFSFPVLNIPASLVAAPLRRVFRGY